MLDFLRKIPGAGIVEGAYNYLQDPTGMDAYRQGLRQQDAAQLRDLQRMQGDINALADVRNAQGVAVANEYSPLAGLASLGAQNMATQNYTTQPSGFQFQGSVEDYLDPSIQFEQDQARRSLESSAMARGSLMSGAAMKAIADRAQQIGRQGYSDAYARMERDRQFGAGRADIDFAQRQANNAIRMQQAQNQAQLGLSGLAGRTNALTGAQNQAFGAQAQAYGQRLNPSDGLGNVRVGEMRGAFTQGLFDSAKDGLSTLISGGLGL